MGSEIDVLMPVHNGGQYLTASVRSTLNALADHGRILIYDDASTDEAVPNTVAQLDRSSRARVEIFRGESNIGIAGALNVLVDHSKAPVLARMDADDLVFPWRFRRQILRLRATRAHVLFSTVWFLGGRSRPHLPELPVPFSSQALPFHLAFGNMLVHPTVIAERHVFDAFRYRALRAEDYDLWMRLIDQGYRLVRDQMPALAFRRHGGSMSHGADQWADNPQLRTSHKQLVEALTDTECPESVLRSLQDRRIKTTHTQERIALEAWAAGLSQVAKRTLTGLQRALVIARIRRELAVRL